MSETIIKTKLEEVRGRVFIKGKIENISPLSVSNGDTEYSDADIYRDDNGVPMIPGTSFMGALKSLLEQLKKDIDLTTHTYLFGSNDTQEKKDSQSHFIIDDLKCISETFTTNVRDGVKINPATNIAEDKGKYDYELLEPGHIFSLNAEITIREGFDEAIISDLLDVFSAVLKEDHLFQVGSLTSFGFGQMNVKSLKKTDILSGEKYFKHLIDESSTQWNEFKSSEEHFDNAIATFNLNMTPSTPLFIGGGKINTPDADDASLQSNGQYILSAKSLKGAVRHQAFRIANTVHDEMIAKHLCNLIFGNKNGPEENETVLTKSHFWTSDGIVKNPESQKSQARVAIDRFTGGAIESALFATEPVWPKEDTSINLKWRLTQFNSVGMEAEKAAIGLLLLVARDLLTEMLPIGGDKAIGRGRFTGNLHMNDINKNDYQLYILAFLNYKIKSDGTK